MENLRTSIIQPELSWENIQENLHRFSKMINSIQETDLILLPEMFSTGFSMHPQNLAEEPEGPTLKWMQNHAKSKKTAISGSIIVAENGQFYNRLYFVFPDGSFQTYDKRHLFKFSGEHEHYSPGKEKLIVEYKGWRLCPMICYDLRFPVWARNVEYYDVLFYGANWPARRILAWDSLLRARSIENICYTIGINRIGEDPNENLYNGHSAIYDPLGNTCIIEKDGKEAILHYELDKNHLQKTRQQFRFLDDKDDFKII